MTSSVVESHSLLQVFPSVIFHICGMWHGPCASAEIHHHHHHRIFVVRRLHENQNSGALHGHLTAEKDLTTKSSIKKMCLQLSLKTVQRRCSCQAVW